MLRGERTTRHEELSLATNGLLPLAWAVQQAVSNSPAVFQARTLLTAAEARWQQARASYLPQLSLTTDHTVRKSYNPSAASTDNFAGRVALQQDLYSFGRQEAALRQARAERTSAETQVQSAINTAAYAARAAYFDLLSAQELLLITEEKVREFTVHLHQARVMVELGTRIRYDITKAEVDLGTARLECLQASNTLHTARAALGRVLGLTEELPVARLAWSTVPPVVGTEAISNLFRFACQNHPACQDLQWQVAAASAAVDFAVANIYTAAEFFGFLGRLLNSLLLLGLNLLSFFLGLICLSFTNLLILIFLISIEFAGTLVACFAHFLAHNLTKGTVSSPISKYSLWFLSSLLLCHHLNVFNARS
jgi:outer membrane protein TolC